MSDLRFKQSFEAVQRTHDTVAATRELMQRAQQRIRQAAGTLEAARSLIHDAGGASIFEGGRLARSARARRRGGNGLRPAKRDS